MSFVSGFLLFTREAGPLLVPVLDFLSSVKPGEVKFGYGLVSVGGQALRSLYLRRGTFCHLCYQRGTYLPL